MSHLTESQMEEVLQRTVRAIRRLNELWGLKDAVLLRPPADPEALKNLVASVPFQLPPSYLQILGIHDGIDDLYGIRGSLLHSGFRLDFPNFDKEWGRPNMWIFIADNDWNAVAFDTDTQSAEGEMEVQEISDNLDADRWPSLSDFLIGYSERMEGWLAAELADRTEADDD
jgi:hypothetical protein